MLHPSFLGLDEVPFQLLNLIPEKLALLVLIHRVEVHLQEMALSGFMVMSSLSELLQPIVIYDILVETIVIYDTLLLITIIDLFC